ncbi:MAG: FxsA family protein, partial [Cucumibacter sp.]
GPIIEIARVVALGGLLGFWGTMGGVLVTASAGWLLLRAQGFATIVRIRQALSQGTLPAQEIVDGVMLAIAGALLLTPGYFTDLLGFLLFVPAIRSAVFRFLRSRITVVATGARRTPGWTRDPEPVDLEAGDWRDSSDGGR